MIEPHFGRIGSVATGVSEDGQVVVGYSLNAQGGDPTRWDGDTQRAFRWTRESGAQDLGSQGRERTWANAVSGDGRVVVGGYSGRSSTFPFVGSNPYRPYRWTPETGMQDLGTLGIDWADAVDVSGDGRVIIGHAYAAGGPEGWSVYAVRWVDGRGPENLGTLSGYAFSHGYGVSNDGRVLVSGTSRGPAPQWHDSEAWRWTPEVGMQGVGLLPPWGSSAAYDVSDDGTTVIGRLFNDYDYMDYTHYPYRSFRWRAETGLQDLGTLGGERTEVWHGVSGAAASSSGPLRRRTGRLLRLSRKAQMAGRLVFGSSQAANGEWRAFRWTPEREIEDLNILYPSALPSGWVLRSVMDSSASGCFLVGWAEGPGRQIRAFLLDTGCLNP